MHPSRHVLVGLTAVVTVVAALLAVNACGAAPSQHAAPPTANPTSAATDAAAERATPPAALTTCEGAAVSAPSRYLLACVDGSVYLDGVRWQDWGAPTAHANGTLWENNCDPNCANGQYLPYPATVTAFALATDRYTRLHVDAPAPSGPYDYTVGTDGPVPAR